MSTFENEFYPIDLGARTGKEFGNKTPYQRKASSHKIGKRKEGGKMRYCVKCGTKVEDDVKICPQCGTAMEYTSGHHSDEAEPYNVNKGSTYDAVIKTFMCVMTVLQGLILLPLLWCIPMTATASKRLEHGEKIGIGFKICIFFFVSRVAGILLFARRSPEE